MRLSVVIISFCYEIDVQYDNTSNYGKKNEVIESCPEFFETIFGTLKDNACK